MEKEFRYGPESAPILLHLEVEQRALSKAWDQQRKNKLVTRENAVSVSFDSVKRALIDVIVVLWPTIVLGQLS